MATLRVDYDSQTPLCPTDQGARTMNLGPLAVASSNGIAAELGESDLDDKASISDGSAHHVNPLSSPTQRIASLDGLRGISIWAVMLAHASAHFASTPLHLRRVHDLLSVMSYFGVTTFFVISGFLITKILLKEHTRALGIDLGQFYLRRAVRILPAALFYIGVV